MPPRSRLRSGPSSWPPPIRVKFHDGAELGAEDVKYTFELIAKAHPTNYQTIGPDSVKVVDPLTVDVTPTKKNNRLAEQVVHPRHLQQGGARAAGPLWPAPRLVPLRGAACRRRGRGLTESG